MTGIEATPAKKSSRLHKLWRGLLWALAGLIILFGILLGGLYWSVSSESGSLALMDALSRLPGGRVFVEGWQGRVYGQFQAKRVRVHLATLDIDLERVSVKWHPAALRFNQLRIDDLQIGRAELRRPISNEAAAMPTSLRLPLKLHIATFNIGLFAQSNRPVGKADQSAPTLILKDIAGSVDSDGDSHRINRLALNFPAGHVTAQGQIKTAAPFALALQAAFSGNLAERAIKVDARADGSLDKLGLKLDAVGQGVAGNADLRLRPFAPLPVEQARVALRGIDPALFSPTAPHALLDVSADLTPRLPAAAKPNSASANDPLLWQISGPLNVINRKPASIDAGGLPIEGLSAQLAWADGALRVDALQVLLPGQGQVKGTLRWQRVANDPIGRIDADLSVRGVNPARLHTHLRPMQIAGSIVGRSVPGKSGLGKSGLGKPAQQEQTFSIDLASGIYRLVAKGGQHDGMLALERAALTAGAASLEAHGRWQWQTAVGMPAQAFDASGRLQHFDPRAFMSSAPTGNLNADFSVDGVLQPSWGARVKLDIADSMLAGYPLQGSAALAAGSDRVHDVDIALDVFGNRLKLAGAFGLVEDRMQVQVDAAQLGRLHSGLHGRLAVQGTVGGTFDEPFAALNAEGDGLGLEGSVNLESLRAKLQLQQGAKGQVDGRVELKGMSFGAAGGAPQVREASLSLTGRRDAHTLHVDAALLKDQTLSASAEGAWHASVVKAGSVTPSAWSGRLTQLLAQGPLALRLKDPADISWSPQHFMLGETSLLAESGSIELSATEWTPLRTVARGRMTGLQIGFAVDEYQRTVMRGKSLQLGAQWDITLAERANGLVRVFREGGDFILGGDAPIALGLETLELNLAAQEDRLALSALMSGKRVGAINFAGSALAQREGSKVSLDPNAPIAGVGHLEMAVIDWIGPLIDQNLRTGGSVVGDFNVLGTADKPQGAGRISGSHLSVSLADQGLRLRDGQVDLTFDAARVVLSKLDFRAERSVPAPDPRLRVLRLPGGDSGSDAGRISGSGGIELKDGQGRFTLQIEHVPLLQRADQWVLVSGSAGISSGWEHMDLSAKLRADAGYFGVPKSGAPALGDDVIVRGRQAKPPQRMRVNADIDFDFGNNFIVKAWGIDTYLDGQLRVQLAQGQQPRATGALRTRDGIFDAYGQKLAIDRGLINFAGPLDNPALNVVAMRKGLAVEAGVEVTGLVQRPHVRLVSDPDVPESEKLSWILLGRPTEAGSGDAGLLISAASAAFGGEGPGIAQRVANGFGFDDVSVGQGGTSNRVVQSRVASNSTGTGSGIAAGGSANEQVLMLGKRLSSKAYLALEQNLVGTESIVKLSYDLTRYLSLIARGGTDNSLDLHYEISFK